MLAEPQKTAGNGSGSIIFKQIAAVKSVLSLKIAGIIYGIHLLHHTSRMYPGYLQVCLMNQKKVPLPTKADYEAALNEFDSLWENPASKQADEKMRQLLAVMVAFEQCVLISG